MDNELEHHGIFGMHWGVRRFQKKDGSLTSAGKKRYADNNTSDDEVSEDYTKAHERKSARSYSTKDLQQIVNRLDLEKKYNNISDETVKKEK